MCLALYLRMTDKTLAPWIHGFLILVGLANSLTSPFRSLHSQVPRRGKRCCPPFPSRAQTSPSPSPSSPFQAPREPPPCAPIPHRHVVQDHVSWGSLMPPSSNAADLQCDQMQATRDEPSTGHLAFLSSATLRRESMPSRRFSSSSSSRACSSSLTACTGTRHLTLKKRVKFIRWDGQMWQMGDRWMVKCGRGDGQIWQSAEGMVKCGRWVGQIWQRGSH